MIFKVKSWKKFKAENCQISDFKNVLKRHFGLSALLHEALFEIINDVKIFFHHFVVIFVRFDKIDFIHTCLEYSLWHNLQSMLLPRSLIG